MSSVPLNPRLRHVTHPLGVTWWFTVFTCCCALLFSVHHQHTLVGAQFVANPVPLNSSFALMLTGIASQDRSGYTVTGVGDVNGDDVDDFVVSAPFAAPFGVASAGQAFLLFGRDAGTPWTPNPFVLGSLDGINGVTFNALDTSTSLGTSVAGVDDVNGDGFNDLLIGTEFGNVAYLVFGTNGTWPAAVNLTRDATFGGVAILGESVDRAGQSVAGVGDVNNDGFPDLAIGIPMGDPPGANNGGRMDVLYGHEEGDPWPTVVELSTYVTLTTGFSVLGSNLNDNCGNAVVGVGDVNGDGTDDVAMGCPEADPHGVISAGIVAVVFGTVGLEQVAVAELDGSNGFVVNAQGGSDRVGRVVSRIGDVNADGLDDFAIGAPSADPNSVASSGEAYLLFGRDDTMNPWPAEVNPQSVDGNNGSTIVGSEVDDFVGSSIQAAGDVNNDGIDDVLVGSRGSGSGGRAFLLYGRDVWPASRDSAAMSGANSVTFEGSFADDSCGISVALVGDVNGDGRGDLAIGCDNADVQGNLNAGQTAIVFGPEFTFSPTTAAPTTTTPTTASPTTGVPTTTPPTMAPTTGVPSTVPPPNPTTAPTTPAPTTAPTTSSPTAAPTTSSPTNSPVTGSPSGPVTAAPISTPAVTPSPTAATCTTSAGALVPPGSACVNGVLVTTANTTAPSGTAVTVTTSVTITGGASFEQPSGSTLVFVAARESSGGTRTSFIAVEGGGCAAIGGDAVVSFEADPSNGGADSTTGTLVLVTADCVMGAFGSVSATTSFEGDECVAIDDGEQVATGSSISVSFDVSNTCANKSGGLSTGVLAGIIGGGAFLLVIVVIGVAVWLKRKRTEKRDAALAGISMHQ